MSAIYILLSQPWIERLGWVLLHFLWQGALITLVYMAARRWLLSTPNARYLFACGALLAMVATPLITWSLSNSASGLSDSILQPPAPGLVAARATAAANRLDSTTAGSD